MPDIALSQGVRQNLLALQQTVDLMSQTQNRLATGKKVNSALDNPTSFFVASGLDNRANDLSRLQDAMGLGINTIQAANDGIESIKKLIESAQGDARSALQAASTAPKATSTATSIVDGNQAAGGTLLTSSEAGSFVANNTISVTWDGSPSVTMTPPFTVTATSTVGDLAAAINADTTLNPPGQPARVNARIDNGRLVVESLTGDGITLAAADGTGAAGSSKAAAAKLLGAPTSSNATSATYSLPTKFNEARSDLAKTFETLKSQIDQVIKDTGFNGVNLLNGDVLKVLFNETNSTSIDVQGVVLDSQGIGLAPVNPDGVSSADSANQWQSDTEINAALDKLDAALNKVRAQATSFGSSLIVLQTRQDFTKQTITTLQDGSSLLTGADPNEEGANLLALQTRQQLSTQALSMASQVDQAVLRLFG